MLQLLAGKFMVPEGAIRILGRPPFEDLNLTCKVRFRSRHTGAPCLPRIVAPYHLQGDLSYLGAQWRRDTSLAGDVSMQASHRAGGRP